MSANSSPRGWVRRLWTHKSRGAKSSAPPCAEPNRRKTQVQRRVTIAGGELPTSRGPKSLDTAPGEGLLMSGASGGTVPATVTQAAATESSSRAPEGSEDLNERNAPAGPLQGQLPSIPDSQLDDPPTEPPKRSFSLTFKEFARRITFPPSRIEQARLDSTKKKGSKRHDTFNSQIKAHADRLRSAVHWTSCGLLFTEREHEDGDEEKEEGQNGGTPEPKVSSSTGDCHEDQAAVAPPAPVLSGPPPNVFMDAMEDLLQKAEYYEPWDRFWQTVGFGLVMDIVERHQKEVEATYALDAPDGAVLVQVVIEDPVTEDLAQAVRDGLKAEAPPAFQAKLYVEFTAGVVQRSVDNDTLPPPVNPDAHGDVRMGDSVGVMRGEEEDSSSEDDDWKHGGTLGPQLILREKSHFAICRHVLEETKASTPRRVQHPSQADLEWHQRRDPNARRQFIGEVVACSGDDMTRTKVSRAMQEFSMDLQRGGVSLQSIMLDWALVEIAAESAVIGRACPRMLPHGAFDETKMKDVTAPFIGNIRNRLVLISGRTSGSRIGVVARTPISVKLRTGSKKTHTQEFYVCQYIGWPEGVEDGWNLWRTGYAGDSGAPVIDKVTGHLAGMIWGRVPVTPQTGAAGNTSPQPQTNYDGPALERKVCIFTHHMDLLDDMQAHGYADNERPTFPSDNIDLLADDVHPLAARMIPGDFHHPEHGGGSSSPPLTLGGEASRSRAARRVEPPDLLSTPVAAEPGLAHSTSAASLVPSLTPSASVSTRAATTTTKTREDDDDAAAAAAGDKKAAQPRLSLDTATLLAKVADHHGEGKEDGREEHTPCSAAGGSASDASGAPPSDAAHSAPLSEATTAVSSTGGGGARAEVPAAAVPEDAENTEVAGGYAGKRGRRRVAQDDEQGRRGTLADEQP